MCTTENKTCFLATGFGIILFECCCVGTMLVSSQCSIYIYPIVALNPNKNTKKCPGFERTLGKDQRSVGPGGNCYAGLQPQKRWISSDSNGVAVRSMQLYGSVNMIIESRRSAKTFVV